MKNQFNIVCTVDEQYVPHASAMLCSLFSNTPEAAIDVYLLTEGITDASAKRLFKLCRRFGHRLLIKNLNVSSLQDARVSDHVTLATYYRVLIPSSIPAEVKTVLFLDSDLIVRRDISEFYNQSLENFTHAAVASPFSDDARSRLGIPAGYRYFNAGVLLLNLELWRTENLSAKILDYIRSHSESLTWWDQDALNAVLYGRWRCCSPKWNAGAGFFTTHRAAVLEVSESEYTEAAKNPCIVHFTGSYKPWMAGFEHPFKSEYYKYLKLAGGTVDNRPELNGIGIGDRLRRAMKICLGGV